MATFEDSVDKNEEQQKKKHKSNKPSIKSSGCVSSLDEPALLFSSIGGIGSKLTKKNPVFSALGNF